MKLQTAKPSERSMRFFTPDLFIRFNSADDAVADQANEEWETATTAYTEHLAMLQGRIPAPELIKLCLHDADVLAIKVERAAPFAIMTLRQDEQVTTLLYLLSDNIQHFDPLPTWNFSKKNTHWLYDEFDLADGQGGPAVHRILLSDGSVFHVPFVAAFATSAALRRPADAGVFLKTA